MVSRMEQIIEDIEDLIDSCKFLPMSNEKIIVNKSELEELIAELKQRTPEEIRRYQKIISQKSAILADAQSKAEQIINQAQIQTSELVSEHQIMQQAYAQANEVVLLATRQAQEIVDSATNDANNIRMGAMSYTDDQLHTIEDILINAIDTTSTRTNNLLAALNDSLKVVSANRAELFPAVVEAQEEIEENKGSKKSTDDTDSDDIDVSKINVSLDS